jgi:hypothetical protein
MDKADTPPTKDQIDFAHALLNAKDDERMVVLIVRMALMHPGAAERMFNCTKIERHRFEFNVGVGRVDLALFHRDGGMTIVELKANGETRAVAAGIGQLFLYESALPFAMKNKAKPPTYVHKVLASPLPPEKALHVMRACNVAGVRYAFLGGFKDLRAAMRKVGWIDGA